MPTSNIIERIAKLNQARLANGKRAPHQPLLLLYMLGRIQQDKPASVGYSEAEPVVSRLIDEFGPPGTQRHRAALPFVHLNKDLWRLDAPPGARHAQLRKANARGQLAPDLDTALRREPVVLREAARLLLQVNFPESYFAAICEAVGLELETPALVDPFGPMKVAERAGARRDVRFREAVLVAYNYACAMCGFDGRLLRDPVGIQAAHVRWHALGGPDETSNGVALCDLHHTLFDRGVLGVDPERRVRVSKRFNGTSAAATSLVRSLESKHLTEPNDRDASPADAHIAWHWEQVFKAA